MWLIGLLIALSVALVWAAYRSGYSFDPGTGQVLGTVAAIVGLILTVFLWATAATMVGDPFERPSNTAWVFILALVTTAGGTALLVGCVRPSGAAAWSLRLAGFLALVLATLGSMSWVLPFFAPSALLALPSLAAGGRKPAGRPSPT